MIKGSKVLVLVLSVLFFACGESTPNCDCYDFYKMNPEINESLLRFQVAHTGVEMGAFFNSYYFESSDEIHQKLVLNLENDNLFSSSPKLGFVKKTDTALVYKSLNEHLQTVDYRSVPNIAFYWSNKKADYGLDTATYFILYALSIPSIDDITNNDLLQAEPTPTLEDYTVGIAASFNEEGEKKWGEFTADNVGNFVAITSKNSVLNAPVINAPIRGGTTLITGGFSTAEAKVFSSALNCDVYLRKYGRDRFKLDMKTCE